MAKDNKIVVSSDGQVIDLFNHINLIEGTNITLLVETDSNNERLNITISSTGGGSSNGYFPQGWG